MERLEGDQINDGDANPDGFAIEEGSFFVGELFEDGLGVDTELLQHVGGVHVDHRTDVGLDSGRLV